MERYEIDLGIVHDIIEALRERYELDYIDDLTERLFNADGKVIISKGERMGFNFTNIEIDVIEE